MFARHRSSVDGWCTGHTQPRRGACDPNRHRRLYRLCGQRLPQIRSISLSTVQPHGRAGRDDGRISRLCSLASAHPEAIERAQFHGSNYSTPIVACHCAWAGSTRSKECQAIEARQGGWRPTPGIENQGDKIQESPAVCAPFGPVQRRTYRMFEMAAASLPLCALQPLGQTPADDGARVIVQAMDGPDSKTWRSLAAAETPFGCIQIDFVKAMQTSWHNPAAPTWPSIGPKRGPHQSYRFPARSNLARTATGAQLGRYRATPKSPENLVGTKIRCTKSRSGSPDTVGQSPWRGPHSTDLR